MMRRACNRSSAPSSSSAGPRPSSALPQPFPQLDLGLRIKIAQPEMAADALRLLAFGRLATRLIEEQHRRQAELAREVVDDRQRRRAVIIEEAAVGAHRAKLQREPPAMVVAAAARHFREIRRRQAPMPRQFVFAGIGVQDAAPTRVQRR
jgi:hypothetical protein